MAGEVPEALRACIGRVATYTAPDPIGEAGIRLFALAMQDDNPLYQDAEVAAASRHGGIVAPPTLLCETNQPCRRAPDDSGYFGHAWDLPLPSKDFLRGGNEYEFHQPARPDDRITVTWTLLDIQARETRNGGLFLVISEARYTNQRGELLAVNRETNIHQP